MRITQLKQNDSYKKKREKKEETKKDRERERETLKSTDCHIKFETCAEASRNLTLGRKNVKYYSDHTY